MSVIPYLRILAMDEAQKTPLFDILLDISINILVGMPKKAKFRFLIGRVLIDLASYIASILKNRCMHLISREHRSVKSKV